MDLRQEQSFQVAEEIGAVEFTEHGSKTYLGNNQWRYRSSVGETNTWNGSHYERYVYDLENKQVSIGKLTFTHGPNGVISVSHSGSGSMIGELKWYAQYYLSDQWQNFTFDNYEYLGATKTDENATIRQRWWSTNGELNVSYTYYYWNELKMRAQATNWAAQTVPVRVLWALTDIAISPDYTLIYDNGVAVGVEIGNEQSIYWHDVTQSAPEININPILDKENRRAAVMFGNMSSVLAQGETMDIDPTYTVAADIDDDNWANPYGSPTHFTNQVYIWFANDTNGPSSWYSRGQIRVALSILKDSTIISAELFGYESYDDAAVSHNCYRIDETNVGSLEGDSSMPSVDKTPTVQWTSDDSASEWTSDIDITDIVQEQVNLADWVSGYYLGLAFETPSQSAINRHAFEDYQSAGTNHAYLEIEYAAPEGEYDYVDTISDLHAPSDMGTHSDFQEMRDKDGSYDTLTEVDIVEIPSEWKYVDGLSAAETVWSTTGASPYLDAQDEPTNRIYVSSTGAISSWYTLADTSGYSSGSDTFTVNASVYWKAVSDSYTEWEVDWTSDGTADASGSFGTQAAYAWSNTGTLSGLDTVAEINQARIRFIHNKGAGGPEQVDIDAARIGIAETGTNYELDLEVGWVTADYDETSEELCIFGGTQGSEALRVDVWDGSWTNIITDLAAGWNNNSVTSYLTDATFEIRFTDTTNESVLADTWQVEAVLLHTWSAAGNEYVEYVFETIPLSDSSAVSMGASETVNEVISISDTSIDSVGFGLVVTEIIGFYDSVVVAMDAVLLIMEQINFSETVSVGANFAITLLAVLGLAASVVATKSGQNEFFVTIFETIGASDSVETVLSASVSLLETIGVSESIETALSASVSVLETIGLTDIAAAYRGSSITVFENIGISSSIETSQLTHYYVYETIGFIDSTSFTGGIVVDPVRSMIYEMFLSLEVWGYLGPALLVIGGYVLSKKELILGVLWFVLECLVVAQYLALVEATPHYWWHIYIILIGGLIMFGFAMVGRRR